MTRRALVERIATLAGPGVVQVDDLQTGWPSYVTICLEDREVPIALFAGPIGLSHRGRDDVERRWQNPGKGRSIEEHPGRLLVLIGVWDEEEEGEGRVIFAAADAYLRLGRMTRYSIFASLALLQGALMRGWQEEHSSVDEHLVAFKPELLSTYVLSLIDNTELDPDLIQQVILATGLLDSGENSERADERARRQTYALVRDSLFRKQVIAAYGGLCAMCGLNFDLIEGAHIYPVSAPNAPDGVTNGLALCCNHHRAFDKHLIWIDPDTYAIRVKADLLSAPNAASRRFGEQIAAQLALPEESNLYPSPGLLRRRYEFFKGHYDWAT